MPLVPYKQNFIKTKLIVLYLGFEYIIYYQQLSSEETSFSYRIHSENLMEKHYPDVKAAESLKVIESGLKNECLDDPLIGDIKKEPFFAAGSSKNRSGKI